MRKLNIAALAGLVVLTMAGAAVAQDAPPKTVDLQRLVIESTATDRRATIKEYIGCSLTRSKLSMATSGDLEVAPYLASFRKVFTEAGLHPQQQANLFEASGGSGAQYALAGVIKSETYDLCIPYVAQQLLNKEDVYGRSAMTIEWQLYSRLESRVVAQTRIVSNFASQTALPGGPAAFQDHAVAENLKLLAADPAIRAALAGPGSAPGQMIKPSNLPALPVDGARSAQPRPIDQAGKSVVVIFAGEGTGSGVLISKDGYILTDAHVVGDAATVRVRWADGQSGTATVLRSSRPRDVALLKVDATGHDPLPLKETPPPVGSTVFCIGAPEGQQFQGTLTRGVVSSMRVMEGLNYIQSDVTTGHGGSGGPLLDDKGYVIGLTVLAVGRDTTSSGLNFFTPIKDAIDFLALELR